MKKKIIALIFTICMGSTYMAYAADCITGFATQYAIAQAEYVRDVAYCSDEILSGPCLEEAEVKYNNAVNTVWSNFSLCCCQNSLAYCCN